MQVFQIHINVMGSSEIIAYLTSRDSITCTGQCQVIMYTTEYSTDAIQALGKYIRSSTFPSTLDQVQMLETCQVQFQIQVDYIKYIQS